MGNIQTGKTNVFRRLYKAIERRGLYGLICWGISLPFIFVRNIHFLLLGVKLHGFTRIHPHVRVQYGRYVEIGKNVTLAENVYLKSIGGKIQIGEGTIVGEYCYINSAKLINIGRNVLIAPFCHLTDRNHGFAKDYIIKSQRGKVSPIFIGDNTWIASSCIILPGVSIGEGCVIGTGSVVTSNITPHKIA